MKDPDSLDAFIAIVGKLERQMVGVILASWVFSLLPLIVQNRRFDVSFNVVVTIVAGVAGMAAILSIYLGRLKHASEIREGALNFYPSLKGLAACITLLMSAFLFYFYYIFAKSSDEICLLFFGMGTFFFFRTLASAASTILTIKQQRNFWRAMSLDDRLAWLKNRQELREVLQSLETPDESEQKFKESLEKTRQNLQESSRRLRWQRFRHMIRLIQWRTYRIRKTLRLTTPREDIFELQVQEFVDELGTIEDDISHRNNVQRIERGEIQPIILEAKGIEYYSIKKFKYFFVTEALDENKVNWYLDGLSGLKEKGGEKFELVVVVVPKTVSVTHEAIHMLEQEGIHLLRYAKEETSNFVARDK